MKLKPAAATLVAGETATLKLKPKKAKRSVRKINALLTEGARGTATIKGVATNGTGVDDANLTLKLKRPA